MSGIGLYFCSLYSGSSGNASLAVSGGTRILVDAGVTACRLEAALAQKGAGLRELDGVLITHEHIDHIRAAGVLARRYDLPVYANEATWQAMQEGGRIGDIPRRNRTVFVTGQDFYIGDICVSAFPVDHDTAQPVGFVLGAGGRQVAVATDLGRVTEGVLRRLRDCDAVLLESNHDVDMLERGRYPAGLKRRILGSRGHLSNAAAAHTLLDLLEHGVRRMALGHLSRDNNTPELAYRTAESILTAAGARMGRDVEISMTWPDRPGAAWAL